MDPSDHTAFDRWATSLTPALLDGLVNVQVLASPMPASWNQMVLWLRQVDELRAA